MMNANAIADVLERAADLIEPEGAWTQGPFAANAEGLPLFDGSADGACSWCICGAIEHVAADDHDLERDAQRAVAILFSADASDYRHIAWNEMTGRTQAEVVAKLREAAARARGPA